MKKKLLFALLSMLLLPLGLKAYDISDNGGSFDVDNVNGVVTFSNTSAGEISANWGNIIGHLTLGTRIRFDKTCEINKVDLEYFLQDNLYYVDLFDITNGTNTPMKVDDKATPDDDNNPYNIDKIILDAVEDMVTNSWAAKGIILPYNSTVGTSNVIKYSAKGNYQSCTFMEYAAYYRESETAKNLVIHVWDHSYWYNPIWGRDASVNYTKAIAHVSTHDKIDAAQTALVSTISDVKFNLSGLSAPIKIEITGDNMIQGVEPGNHIPDKADIYVNSTKADDLFAGHIQTTGTKNTPTNLLHLTGAFSAADIAAVNQFTPWDQTVNPYHGPRVLDLSHVTTPSISVDILNSLANKDIEYIILPPGVSKDVVLKADYSDLDKLKAVVSSSSTDLVAYVKVPGSLAEARMLVTGKDDGYYYIPTTVDFKNVSLGGNLNAADICAKTTVNNSGLAGITTIESIDLTYAVFANNEDMNFQTAGLIDNDNPFTEIILPKSLETIPDHCFQKLPQSLTHICIPYNVKHIGERAFDETYINHITTTDAKGAEIDNGVGTYTFSANLKYIETGAFHPVEDEEHTVFISDIYVLATEVPHCENWAFRKSLTFGYYSYGYEGVYCRDHYYPLTVLHFPSQPQGMSDADYKAMQKKYTDIDKVYTKRDQTGAVDANGNPLLWPTWAEISRVYNQATWTVNGNRVGVTWNDWNVEYSPYNGVNWEPASDISQPTVCSFAGYEGWHEFVLTMASYVPPTEEKVDERNYVEDRWYTFCIPFDMTEDEVIKLLGVPATEVDNEGKVTGSIIYKYDGEMVTDAKMPKIHTLKSINRELNGSRGIITLFMSDDLAVKDQNGKYTYFIPSQDISTEGTYAPNVPNEEDKRGEAIVIRGGYPYLIKPYRRTNETITNLGLSVLNRYAFPSVASSVYREGCYIELGGEHSREGYPAYKSPFAVPYKGHEVQAAFFKTGGDPTKAQYKDGEDMKDYKYRFMGQYWQQPLPLNSYYISSKGNWNYYQTEHEGWYWKPYNCVINVGSELDVAKTTYFQEVGMDPQGGAVFDGQLHLEYKGGHNDSFVVNENQSARSIRIVFDEAIEEYDSEGNVMTAIESIDGQDLAPFSPCKVYDMKGQYVGSSLDGLQKGIYIVKGKKVVVD